jgi:hypothetical protein
VCPLFAHDNVLYHAQTSRYADSVKPAPSLFRRRLKAKVKAQANIRLEAARRLVALGGTAPDLEDIKRVRADEGGKSEDVDDIFGYMTGKAKIVGDVMNTVPADDWNL